MAHGYVALGSGNEESGINPAGVNINGGDDIYAAYIGAGAANLASMAGMRARLLAIGGAFTASYVDQLSINDMAYAIRVSGG